MIEKIGARKSVSSVTNNNFSKSKSEKVPVLNLQTNKNLAGANMVEPLKAMYGINFKGKTGLTELEASFINKSEIRIPNLLEIEENISISRRQMPKGSEKLNAAGLNVDYLDDGEYKTYTITNDKDYVIAIAKFEKDEDDLPIVTYKQGKYMPELTIKHQSLGSKAIKMLAGSQIIAPDFEIIMPGQYEPNPGKGYKGISFTGRVAITTLNKEQRTLEAVEKYNASGLQQETTKGDYYDLVQKYDPNIVIPAGGFGERFKNITREWENKPSAKMPTSDNYRIIGTTLNLAAAAGILKGNGEDEIIYLSQNHEIPNEDSIYWVPKFSSDGGAIAEGMKRGLIRNDKDTIILNADIFTNADITRAYKALKTLPDAALVIPYYPVDAERAQSFGLLGVEQDDNSNLQIKQFVEKPKYTDEAPDPNDFNQAGDYDEAMAIYDEAQMALNPQDETTFLANPGMYFLSKEASKILMAQGIISPDETFLGKDIMPKIIKLINEGKLVDKYGNPMKAYTVPLERKGGKLAVWDDVGTAEAYLKIIKDVASQVQENGTGLKNKYYGVPEFVMQDFARNVDLKTGIVFDSKEARHALDDFIADQEVQDIRGNIFVAGK